MSGSEEDSSLTSEQLSNAALVFAYSLIVLVSLFGNLFVCRVMLSLTSSRTTTNVLIFNLAVSDLLLTTFNIPVNIVRFVARDWPFGSLICTATPFIQSLSAHCSSITMMVIAFERYRSLIGIQSLQACCQCVKRYTFRGCVKGQHSGDQSRHRPVSSHQSSWLRLVILIWLCSTILSIPHSLYNKVVVYEGLEMVRCAAIFPDDQARLMIAILTPTSQYLLPIGLTGLFYARIGHFLWRRTDPVGSVSEGRRLSILRRKRKRVKMLVVVVAVFALCWLPLHLYVTLIEFGIIQHHFGIFFVTHWIAMSSVCYNPFIYCWLNETFRRKTDSMLGMFVSIKNCLQRIPSVLCCVAQYAPDGQNSELDNGTGNDLESTSQAKSSAKQKESCRILITQDLSTNFDVNEE